MINEHTAIPMADGHYATNTERRLKPKIQLRRYSFVIIIKNGIINRIHKFKKSATNSKPQKLYFYTENFTPNICNKFPRIPARQLKVEKSSWLSLDLAERSVVFLVPEEIYSNQT